MEATTRTIERSGKVFAIRGPFGNVSIYHDKTCLAFGLMTRNDAENWVWSRYPARAAIAKAEAA